MKDYKSEEKDGFYYKISPIDSKSANVSVHIDNQCVWARPLKRESEETLDQFVIRLHSTGVKETIGRWKDYDSLVELYEKLSDETLAKFGDLNYYLEEEENVG